MSSYLTFLKRSIAIAMLLYTLPQVAIAQTQREAAVRDALENQTAGRMPGARIVAPSCDPGARLETDAAQTNTVDGFYPGRSCAAQSITRDNFKIKLEFDPSNPPTTEAFTVYSDGAFGLPCDTNNDGRFDDLDSCPLIACDADNDGASDDQCIDDAARYNGPFYDSNGNTVSGATAANVVHTGLGYTVTYNNTPLYTEPGEEQKYPVSAPFMSSPQLDTSIPPQPIPNCDGNGMWSKPQDGTIDDFCPVQMTYSNACVSGTPGYTAGHRPGELMSYGTSGQVVYGPDCQELTDCNGATVKAGDVMYVRNGLNACVSIRAPGVELRSVQNPDVESLASASLFLTRFDKDYSEVEKGVIAGLGLKDVWLEANQEITLYDVTRVSFEMRYEGNYACVYAFAPTPGVEWRVEQEYPMTMEEVVDLEFVAETLGSVEGRVVPRRMQDKLHCFPAPPPATIKKHVIFSSIVAEVCSKYDTSGSEWVKPFTGVVMECVEKTISNIFVPATVTIDGVQYTAPDTFFSRTQDKLQNFVRGVLAIFVIVFGFRLIYSTQVPQRGEIMWTLIKLALVVYFALGSGMAELFPRLITVTKGLSLVMMRAGLGNPDSTLSTLQAEVTRSTNDIIGKQKAITDKEAEKFEAEADAAENGLGALNSQTLVQELEAKEQAAITERDRLKTILDRETLELQQVQGGVAALEQAYKDNIAKIGQLTIDLANAIKASETAAINTALATYNQAVSQQQAAVNSLVNAYNQVTSAKNNVSLAQTDIQNANIKIGNANTKINSANGEIATANTTVASNPALYAPDAAANTELNGGGQARDLLTTASGQLTTAQTEEGQISSTITGVTTELGDMNSLLASPLVYDVNNAQVQTNLVLTELQAALTAAGAMITEVQQAVTQTTDAYNASSDARTGSNEAITATQADIQDLVDKRDYLAGLSDGNDYSADIAALNAAITSANQDISDAQQLLGNTNGAQKDLSQANTAISTASGQVGSASTSVTTVSNNYNSISSALTTANTELKRAYDAYNTTVTALSGVSNPLVSSATTVNTNSQTALTTAQLQALITGTPGTNQVAADASPLLQTIRDYYYNQLRPFKVDATTENKIATAQALLAAYPAAVVQAQTDVANSAVALCNAGGNCYGNLVPAAQDGQPLPTSSLVTAQAQYDMANQMYQAALAALVQIQTDLATARVNYATLSASATVNFNPATYDSQLSTLRSQLTTMQTNAKNATIALTQYVQANAGGNTTLTGYGYCDFRFVEYAPGYEYMELWDMIDCKVSRYLGIGDSTNVNANGVLEANPSIPHVLWVSMIAVISTALGIPIFLLAMLILISILIIVVRVCHIYIMAFISVAMLIFVCPLLIPTIMFKFTRKFFDEWLQQLVGYLFQPIILFAYLSMMFASMDQVVFGGNKIFIPTPTIPVPYQIAGMANPTQPANASTCDIITTGCNPCYDPTVMGCILQTTVPYSIPVKLGELHLFNVFVENLGNNRDLNLLLGILKLLLVCFIACVIMKTVETLSSRFTAMMTAGGAAAFAAFGNNPGPGAVLGAIRNTGGALYNAGEKSVKKLRSSAEQMKMTKDLRKGKEIKKEPSETDKKRQAFAGSKSKGGSDKLKGAKDIADFKESLRQDKQRDTLSKFSGGKQDLKAFAAEEQNKLDQNSRADMLGGDFSNKQANLKQFHDDAKKAITQSKRDQFAKSKDQGRSTVTRKSIDTDGDGEKK